METKPDYLNDIKEGERFGFGKNWSEFLDSVGEKQIGSAKNSFLEVWPYDNLSGKTFLDIGSGSGLSSLIARGLGAKKIFSFDYDQDSVSTSKKIKNKYDSSNQDWHIEQGSVLDEEYMKSLGKFDVVYSWGVLHHTGQMWKALEHAQVPVADNGYLFIAIYNDQGTKSKVWHFIKKTYCSGRIGRLLMKILCIPYFIIGGLALDIVRLDNPIKRYTEYSKKRGMSVYHDWIDWIGGLPFEVATPKVIEDFYSKYGLTLVASNLTDKLGCNEFVFKKSNS